MSPAESLPALPPASVSIMSKPLAVRAMHAQPETMHGDVTLATCTAPSVNLAAMPVQQQDAIVLAPGDTRHSATLGQTEQTFEQFNGKAAEITITVLPGLVKIPGEILQPQLAIDFFRRFEHES